MCVWRGWGGRVYGGERGVLCGVPLDLHGEETRLEEVGQVVAVCTEMIKVKTGWSWRLVK